MEDIAAIHPSLQTFDPVSGFRPKKGDEFNLFLKVKAGEAMVQQYSRSHVILWPFEFQISAELHRRDGNVNHHAESS